MSTKKIYLIHDYIAILTQLILLYFVQTFMNISSSTNINYLFGLIYLPILLTCYLSLKHLKTIIVFIFASLAIYLLIIIFHIDSFLYNLFLPIIIKIKHFLISFINWIIGAISSNSGDTIDYEFENSSTDFNLGTNSGEPSLFWKIVSFLSNTLKVIVIVFLIYKAIDIIYKFFSNNFKKKMDDSDTVTSIKNTRDNYSSLITKNVFKFLKPKDNNTKIRNLYIKLVSSSKVANQNNINSMTAKEISSIISKDKSVDELTRIYEKARYRDIECSKEEVNKAKKLL